jgi:hypothetical protein
MSEALGSISWYLKKRKGEEKRKNSKNWHLA